MASSIPSYPTGPSREYPPRLVIIGGFVIDIDTCAAWGSRILGEYLDPKTKVNTAYGVIVYKLLREYKTNFTGIGETTGSEWMVVTQSARFKGWKDMDPALIPQFQEGEREAIARKLLEQEGAFLRSFPETCSTLTRWLCM
jgi:hypothetical protein